MWVFVYKMNKHGFLQKCKARLVICGNQQALEDLSIKITILIGMTFHALIVITAKFDLEIVQLDAINIFINCKLDEIIYIKHPPGFKIG